MSTRQSGFTLVELLLVIVIVGLLAAIAVPKFNSTRDRAFLSALRADLRNLAAQQDIHFDDAYTYSSSLADLDFVVSDGVTITIVEAAGTGWSASATHVALGTAESCAIYHGDVSPLSPATVVSTVQCTR